MNKNLHSHSSIHSNYRISSLLVVFCVSMSVFVSACDKSKVDAKSPLAPVKVADGSKNAAAHEPEAKNYAIVTPKDILEVGGPNPVVLEIQSRNGLKINHEFPWKIKFKSTDKLIVDEAELTADQIEMGDKSVRMKIHVTPTEEGTFDLEGTGTFSVCSVKLCDIKRNEPLRFTFVAEYPG